jgi:hypothetical protein
MRVALSSWHLGSLRELSQVIDDRWRISRPKVDLIVPDAEVLGQRTQPRDRRFGLAHLPFHNVLRRHAQGSRKGGPSLPRSSRKSRIVRFILISLALPG